SLRLVSETRLGRKGLVNEMVFRGSNTVTRLKLIWILLLTFAASGVAQTTISTGSIQGSVLDPSNALVSGAKVTISNKATGQVLTTATNSAGTYASGALIPGNYVVRVEQAGFKSVELPIKVEVGVTAPGSLKLQVGNTKEL